MSPHVVAARTRRRRSASPPLPVGERVGVRGTCARWWSAALLAILLSIDLRVAVAFNNERPVPLTPALSPTGRGGVAEVAGDL